MALGLSDPARPALCFADVADNPGGGGRGNTMWILEAFHLAGVRGAVVGVIHDPAPRRRGARTRRGRTASPRASTATAAIAFSQPVRGAGHGAVASRRAG